MTPEEIENRFSYHPPLTDETKQDHEHAREACRALAELFDQLLPEGREKSVSMTKIEEVMFWANAAIARKV